MHRFISRILRHSRRLAAPLVLAIFLPPAHTLADELTADANVAKLLGQVEGDSREMQLDAMRQLRRVAIDGQIGTSNNTIITFCVRLMEQSDDELAEAACDVICWLDADAVPGLVNLLKSDTPNAQAFAARAISTIASRNRDQAPQMDIAIEPLSKLIAQGPHAARHNAVYALSQLGPAAIPQMAEELDQPEPFITVMTKGFVRHGEASIDPLCNALRRGNVGTRRNAAHVLFMLSWQVADIKPVMAEVAMDILVKSIEDEDIVVRRRAVATLGRLEEYAETALPNLFKALRQQDAPHAELADAIGRIGPRREHLDDLFQAAVCYAEASQDAEKAASRFGVAIAAVGEDGVERVIKKLGDSEEIIQQTAMYALLEMGPVAAPAVPAVIEKLNRGDRLAADVLRAIGPQAKEAVPDLISALQGDQWAMPRSSLSIMHHSSNAMALAAIGPAALPNLLDGLKNENDLVRAGCLKALAEINPEAMVPLPGIITRTSDKNPIVRGLALVALAKHGDQESLIPVLKRLIDDGHPAVADLAQRQLAALNKDGSDE